MLVKVWEKKFGGEVRSFEVADINSDGLDEVAVCSWDSRIYLISGSGEVLWRSERQEYPSENIIIIYDSLQRPYAIVGSFHRKIIGFNPMGEKEWIAEFTSWITKMVPIRRRGCYDKIFISDIKGNIALLSYTGEVLWSKEKSINPWSYSAEHIERLGTILVLNADLLDVYSLDGQKIKSLKLGSKGYSICTGKTINPKREFISVGCDQNVIVYDGDFKQIQKIRAKNQAKFRLTKFADIDGDANDELIVGSWVGDRINIYDYDEEKQKFLFTKSYKLASNPLYVASHDVDGDGIKELFIVDNSGTTYYINSEKMETIETVNSQRGIAFGDLLGYGDKDIIVRQIKESIACYISVPRIHSEFTDEKYTSGYIKAIIPSGLRVDVDPTIQIDTKQREYTRRTYNKKSIMHYKIPFRIKYDGKVAKVRVLKKKERVIEGNIFIPTTGQIDSFVKVVAIASEDRIVLKDIKVTKKSNISIYSDQLGINELKIAQDGKIDVMVSHNLDSITPTTILVEKVLKSGYQTLKKYELFVVPVDVIKLSIDYHKSMTTEQSINISMKNNSNAPIPYQITTVKLLKIKQEGTIKPKTKKNVNIKPIVASDALKINVKDIIKINYGRYIKHQVEIPIRFILFNIPKIKEKANKIYKVTKDKKVVIRNLCAELGISEEDLRSMIKL